MRVFVAVVKIGLPDRVELTGPDVAAQLRAMLEAQPFAVSTDGGNDKEVADVIACGAEEVR